MEQMFDQFVALALAQGTVLIGHGITLLKNQLFLNYACIGSLLLAALSIYNADVAAFIDRITLKVCLFCFAGALVVLVVVALLWGCTLQADLAEWLCPYLTEYLPRMAYVCAASCIVVVMFSGLLLIAMGTHQLVAVLSLAFAFADSAVNGVFVEEGLSAWQVFIAIMALCILMHLLSRWGRHYRTRKERQQRCQQEMQRHQAFLRRQRIHALRRSFREPRR